MCTACTVGVQVEVMRLHAFHKFCFQSVFLSTAYCCIIIIIIMVQVLLLWCTNFVELNVHVINCLFVTEYSYIIPNLSSVVTHHRNTI